MAEPPATIISDVVTMYDDPLAAGMKKLFSTSIHSQEFSCKKCHAAGTHELAWQEPAAGNVQTLPSAQELCLKCHADLDSTRLASAGTAHPDFTCLSCHNAHSSQASCTQSACHLEVRTVQNAEIEKPASHPTEAGADSYMCGGSACHDLAKQARNAPVYHQPTHKQVPCSVCHDSSGMTPIRQEDGFWVTINAPSQESTSPEPVASHSIGRKVACQKCHAFNNPWKLVEILP